MEKLINKGLLIKNLTDISRSPISISGLDMLLGEFKKAHKSIKVTIIKEDDVISNSIYNLINKIIGTIDNIEYDSYITDIYLDLDIENTDKSVIDKFRSQLINIKEHKNIIDLLLHINNVIETDKDKKELNFSEIEKSNIQQCLKTLLIIKNILKDKNFINDLMCFNILNIKKKENKLNFFVWSGLPNTNDGTRHNSLVMNYNDKYYFIDSCYNDFKRNPSNFMFEQNYFKYKQVFITESTLQKDDFNCTSFCYEIIKNFTNRFERFSNDIIKFNTYLSIFFNSNVEGTKLISEKPNNELFFVKDEKLNTLSLLPFEILKLCQSYTFLKKLRKKIELIPVNIANFELIKEIKDNFNFLDKIDENMEYSEKIKLQEINIKRKEHLQILEKICDTIIIPESINLCTVN